MDLASAMNAAHNEFVSGLRRAMSLPEDWHYVAGTFAGNPLSLINNIPQEDIAVVSSMQTSREPQAVRMTFFLSPAGVENLKAKCKE